ncbi:hypothetical protein FE784_22600 [Paenibacillus hemerocallicola]|uniref:Uncharacterized protein n=1 Tax=Paenibacillus hemerocallicola TaxID=1172614 RepID=A0A5C4T547_9BACL|nr:hypothetical protein [Paenibacillus hemerocallicola]TNJ63956.1 hypothetical protein FE784_22600 [Paenibacillus hemerocallicola]
MMTPEGLAKGATVSSADSVPTAGDWVRGSLVYKTDVSSSDYVGWVCVTGGTSGVWEPFGRIGEERLVLRSPLGSRYAVPVTNTGTLQTSLL